MNFFLLLSALFTTLTGAVVGVRPVSASVQGQVVMAAVTRSATARMTVSRPRPVQGWSRLPLRPAVADQGWTLALAVASFGQRRRE